MELRHLRTFMAVQRHASFTRAAETLGITQAAVSQHVAQLESELGVLLFHRGARRVESTPAGDRLARYAGQILELVWQATESVGKAVAAVSGTLRIAASTVPAEVLLPSLLAEFRRKFPDVREAITVSDSRTAAAAVENGDADVGFIGKPADSAKLACRPIAGDELTLIVSAQHVLASRSGISLKQLADLPLVVRQPGSGSRLCLEQALWEHGIGLDDLQVVMVVNSNEAIRAAVEQCSGAAFLSATTMSPEIAAGRLSALKVRGLPLRRQLFLIHAQRPAPQEPLRSFLAMVDER